MNWLATFVHSVTCINFLSVSCWLWLRLLILCARFNLTELSIFWNIGSWSEGSNNWYRNSAFGNKSNTFDYLAFCFQDLHQFGQIHPPTIFLCRAFLLSDIPVNQEDKLVFLVSPLEGLLKSFSNSGWNVTRMDAKISQTFAFKPTWHGEIFKWSRCLSNTGLRWQQPKGKRSRIVTKKSPPWIGFKDLGLRVKENLTCGVGRFSLIKALRWVGGRQIGMQHKAESHLWDTLCINS